MTPVVIQETIRSYIRENFLYARPNVELSDTEKLIGSGILDSMGVMEIVAYLQDEFNVEISDEDIIEENLGTIASIARLVSSKLVAAA